MKTIFEKVRTEIADYTGVEIDKITKETNIFDDLGFDSLGVIGFGMKLMSAFDGVEIPLERLSMIRTVGEFCEEIEKITSGDD